MGKGTLALPVPPGSTISFTSSLLTGRTTVSRLCWASFRMLLEVVAGEIGGIACTGRVARRATRSS